MRCRICEVVQYEKNPKTGEDLHFDEEVIKAVLSKHKRGIKRYAYIRHDRDTFTEEDIKNRIKSYKLNGICEEKDMQLPNVGDLKPAHWHVELDFGTTLFDTSAIAKWFGVPENCIAIPKGHGAFLDMCDYITHRKCEGKEIYGFDEVKSNFNLETELNSRDENRLKYGRDLTPKERMSYDILYNGKTIKECIKEDDLLYMKNMREFDNYRLAYLKRKDPPKTKINYLISGRSGFGKSLLSKGLARTLFPDIEDDDEIFFEVGADNVGFEGYDGQPVIIWDDFRAEELLDVLNGRGNVFKVFDPVGNKKRQDVKYNSVVLTNKVNIVNSVQSYEEFLNVLAGEYVNKQGRHFEAEDKNQSYRRFPFIIPIRIDDCDLYINKGWAQDNQDFQEYLVYNNVRLSMQKLEQAYTGEPAEQRLVEKEALQVVEQEYRKYENKYDEQQLSDEERDALRKEIKETYGKCYGGITTVHANECPYE